MSALPLDPSRPSLIELAAEKETGPFFLGFPERWLDAPRWRCAQGHVSGRYLNSEEHGLYLCLGCYAKGKESEDFRVWLTFPEDTEPKPFPADRGEGGTP